jgi:hypothetical protein
MKRFTVLGFTEAELGFVLAALFAAMAMGAVGTSTDVQRLEATRDSLAAALDSVSARRDSAVTALTVLRDSVVRADSAKRSTKTPRCTEKGEPPDAVADVRIRGANQYELAGTRMSWEQLSRRLAPQISRSSSLGCRYLVIARASSGVDAAAHTDAVARLLRYFDVAHRTR